MTLTADDRTYITETVRDTVIDALEQIVLPRFDEQDKEIQSVKADVAVLKEDVRILKDDMRDVKLNLEELNGRVTALEADIKELYLIQVKHAQQTPSEKKFAKLSLEKKLLKINTELLITAREAGITLPR